MKKKFKSAKEAQTHRELSQSWSVLTEKYKTPCIKQAKSLTLVLPTHRSNKNAIPSKVTPGGTASAKPSPVYTGSKMLGVAVLHKSNAVPVFTSDEIIDVARMRR